MYQQRPLRFFKVYIYLENGILPAIGVDNFCQAAGSVGANLRGNIREEGDVERFSTGNDHKDRMVDQRGCHLEKFSTGIISRKLSSRI